MCVCVCMCVHVCVCTHMHTHTHTHTHTHIHTYTYSTRTIHPRRHRGFMRPLPTSGARRPSRLNSNLRVLSVLYRQRISPDLFHTRRAAQSRCPFALATLSLHVSAFLLSRYSRYLSRYLCNRSRRLACSCFFVSLQFFYFFFLSRYSRYLCNRSRRLADACNFFISLEADSFFYFILDM